MRQCSLCSQTRNSYQDSGREKGALKPSKYLCIISSTAPIKSAESVSSGFSRIIKQKKKEVTQLRKFY